MSVVISGALIDGAGIPMSGCHIILKSRVNTSEVVMRTVADVVTGNCGEYCFKAQTGKYCVYLKQDWRDEYCVGDIAVYDDSKPGTLNDFLTALDEGDLKPDVVKRFEEMVAQAQQSAEAAAESEQLAGQYAADAAQAQKSVETLAGEIRQDAVAIAENVQKAEKLASDTVQNAARAEQAAKDADKIVEKAVDKLGESATLTGEAKAGAEAAARSEQKAANHAQNAAGSAQKTAQDVAATETARDDAERYAEATRQDAVATAEDRKATAEDVKSSGENAAEARQSALDAAGYARAAEQAKTDIDITLAGTLKTANHLSEIAAAGTEAQQESRDNLGLKSAATMEPQSDIYDRTKGRVAIPGAFGFGGIIPDKYRVMFSSDEGPSEFINWVRETTPGKYLVGQYGGIYHQPIIKWDQWGLSSSTPFDGLVEIEIRTDNYNPARTRKHVTFKGYNGLIFSATVPTSVNWPDFVKSWTLISLEPYYFARMLFDTDGWREGGAPKAAGGLTLAAYVGRTDDDNSRKLGRYTMVSGSRLRTLSIVTSSLRNSPSTPQFTIGDGLYGSYISLSGFLNTVVGNTEALVGLFIRSA